MEESNHNTSNEEIYDDGTVQDTSGAYNIVLLVITLLVGAAALYVAWCYVSADRDWGFDIEWKFWNSSVLWPALSILGFFLQFIDWQHTSFKEGWVVKDSWGRESFVENNDIMSTLWGGCLFPLIAHLFLIPCAYGAALYYLVMVPFALVNAIIPYLAAVGCVAIAVIFYLFSRNFQWQKAPFVKLAVSAIAALALLWLISLPTSADFSFGNGNTASGSSSLPAAIGQTTVTVKVANLRKGPGTEYDYYVHSNGSKLQAFINDQLSVVEDQGEWYKVLTSDGGVAYIKKTLCTPMVPNTPIVEEPIEDSTEECAPEEACDTSEDDSPAVADSIGVETNNSSPELQSDASTDQPEYVVADSIAV